MDRLNQSFHIRRENISDITDAECISIRNLSGIDHESFGLQLLIKICKIEVSIRIEERSNNWTL